MLRATCCVLRKFKTEHVTWLSLTQVKRVSLILAMQLYQLIYNSKKEHVKIW